MINFKENFYFLNFFCNVLKKYLKKVLISNGGLNVYLKRDADLFFFLYILNKHLFFNFDLLVEVTCIDNFKIKNRFDIVYSLNSTINAKRIDITISLDSSSLVSSVTSLFFNANWMEREVFDLFGINFYNHSDLRRILTDYGFIGYPFRKDFPLNGFCELRYDENRQYIVYEKIELMQTMRHYDFLNPYTKYLI